MTASDGADPAHADRAAMLMMGMPSPEWAALAVEAGCEAIVLDGEHGFPLDGIVRPFVVSARSAGGKCIVRLPRSAIAQAGVLSDIGVSGFILPGVVDLDELVQLRRQVSMAAGGLRGLNPFVPAAGVPGDSATLALEAEQVEIWAMAETREFLDLARAGSLDGIADICAGVVIGPYDLSVALGCDMNPDDEELLAAVRDLGHATERAGVRCALFARDPESLARWRASGVDPHTVIVGYDRDIWFQELRRRVKDVVGEGRPGRLRAGGE